MLENIFTVLLVRVAESLEYFEVEQKSQSGVLEKNALVHMLNELLV